MRHFVSGEIIEHVRWRENEPPRIGEYARCRARAPAARLIAHGHAPDADAEHRRIAAACGFHFALRFAFEVIAHAACKVLGVAGDTEERRLTRLAPDRATR